MECLTGDELQQIPDETFAFAERQFTYRCASISFIPENGGVDMFEMNTDLMCSSCMEYQLDKRKMFKVFLYPVFRDRCFPILSLVIVTGHDFSVACRAADVGSYYSFRVIRCAPDNCLVFLLDLPVCKLSRQLVQGRAVFGCDNQPGGVFVEPVHNAGSEVCCVKFVGIGAEMVQNSVGKCACPVAESRMDDHSRRFIDYHEVIVLIHDIKRNIFRSQFRRGRPEKGDLYGVEGFYFVIGFDGFSVHQDPVFRNGFLNLVPGGVFNLLCEIHINTHRFLGLCNLKSDFFWFRTLCILFFGFVF